MEIRRLADVDNLAQSAAELIFEDCIHTIATRPGPYTLGLSGGRTPVLLFEALTKLPMPWNRVHLFQVDERVAPAGSDDRNLTQLTDRLLTHVNIPDGNVHPMPVENNDLASGCRQYEDVLHRVTGGAPLDALQLGLGDDGHTASLAPGDRILDLSDRDVWYVTSFNGLPRMTMTYQMIDRAQKILWLVAGPTKAIMCRRLIASDHAIPAGRVAQEHALLLVDEDAGGLL